MKRLLTGILILTLILTTLTGCSSPFSKKNGETTDKDVDLDNNMDDDGDSESICELEVISEEEEDAEILDDTDEESREEEEKIDDNKKNGVKSLPYRLEVDVTNQVVTAYRRDNSGNYTDIARQMICTTGANATPTPLGTFKMPGEKGRWGYFTKFDVYAQYWNRIDGSILFHSVLFKKQDESTISMASVNNLGRPVSHGCVRLTVTDAKWIYDNCLAGTEVEVLQKNKNTALTDRLRDSSAESTAKPKPETAPAPKPKPKPKPKPEPTPKPKPILILSDKTSSLKVGESKNVKLVYRADTGDKEQVVTDKAQWTSSNESVASVDKGRIIANTEGRATIAATYNGLSTTLEVSVSAPPTPSVVTLTLEPNQDIYIGVDETANITLRAHYDNGDIVDITKNEEVEWRFSDIITLKEGIITGIKDGRTLVQILYKDKEISTRVIVDEKNETEK